MAKIPTKGTCVHLDHLIRRQSLRYQAPEPKGGLVSSPNISRDVSIRFDDIRRKDGWFSGLMKPDFQRATCAWDPDDCLKFLDSVVHRRIIPSIILWRSNETGQVYVLDGAHRLSVLRAWMIDDWGDKADNAFYAQSENYQEILTAANTVRDLVGRTIGSFHDFEADMKEWDDLAYRGGTPYQELPEIKRVRSQFLREILMSNRTLQAQWEEGDYEAAEASFLAINRQGAPLDPTEQLLIEFRNGGICRTIMSIANDGAAGHYWPTPPPSHNLDADALSRLNHFPKRCADISKTLFVPPFDSKILDINVPLVVTSADSRRHQNLIEIVPILSERYPVEAERYVGMLQRSITDDFGTLIEETDSLLARIESSLAHLADKNHSSTTLSVVPLIYWYNKRGTYVRALFYGFCYWLLSGDDAQIQERKIAFSAVRGRLERFLIEYKDQLALIQHNTGSGFKSAKIIADTIQQLVEALLSKLDSEDCEVSAEVRKILGGGGKNSDSVEGKSRAFSKGAKSEINIRSLLDSAIRCEICDGVVDLKQGVQYDHIQEYASGGPSISSNGRPAHPFCNLFRARIEKIRSGEMEITLPASASTSGVGASKPSAKEKPPTLFDAFPEELVKIHA